MKITPNAVETSRSSCLDDVAIIGAGLAGCALALDLSARGVPVRIYESRPANAPEVRSGVVLTPNGTSVLDYLGVFARIKSRCYVPTHRVVMNDRDEIITKLPSADEDVYGYANYRIWRKWLLEEMKAMLVEREVKIHYESKFQGVVSDGEDDVEFLINQEPQSASLLVGADGIFSSVRKYTNDTDIAPEYTGILAVLTHIKRSSVAWPSANYELNATIQGQPGALFFLPEDSTTEQIMVGTQAQYPQQSREDLRRLQADKDQLVQLFRKGYEDWGPTPKSILDQIAENPEECFCWPFLRIPRLPRWFSRTGRVLILGDAAHAVPPSSAQGINQALEDVQSLSLFLASVRGRRGQDGTEKQYLLETLAYWQNKRQDRIEDIFDWATNATNVERMPEGQRKQLIAEGKLKEEKSGGGVDLSWLYISGLREDVKTWVNDESWRHDATIAVNA